MPTPIQYFLPCLVALLDFGDAICLARCPPPIFVFQNITFQPSGQTHFQHCWACLLPLCFFSCTVHVPDYASDTNLGTTNFFYTKMCDQNNFGFDKNLHFFIQFIFFSRFNRYVCINSTLRACYMRGVVIGARYTKLKRKAPTWNHEDMMITPNIAEYLLSTVTRPGGRALLSHLFFTATLSCRC